MEECLGLDTPGLSTMEGCLGLDTPGLSTMEGCLGLDTPGLSTVEFHWANHLWLVDSPFPSGIENTHTATIFRKGLEQVSGRPAAERKCHFFVPSDADQPPTVHERHISSSNAAKPSPPGPSHGRQFRERATEALSKHKCHICGKKFKTITNYNRHKNSTNCSGQKRPHRYHCTYTGCNRSYSRKDNLDKHGRQKHGSGTADVPSSEGGTPNDTIALEPATQFSSCGIEARFLDIDELE
ncbi:hypothetical protein BDD12DRAFT_907999, partial [Trichophaea hybrida]